MPPESICFECKKSFSAKTKKQLLDLEEKHHRASMKGAFHECRFFVEYKSGVEIKNRLYCLGRLEREGPQDLLKLSHVS